MATTYLQVNPLPGKWYVSERLPAKSKGWRTTDPDQSQPKRTMAEMILAGPFDTHAHATTWNTLTNNASGYIWVKEPTTTDAQNKRTKT